MVHCFTKLVQGVDLVILLTSHGGTPQRPFLVAAPAVLAWAKTIRCQIDLKDVTLFDVIGGRLAVEHQLSEAPVALRSFMLGNITPGVDAD